MYAKIPSGVYIQGVSGTLYTEAEWNWQESPNGVAVVTSNCSFVISLKLGSQRMWSSSYNYTLVEGITTTTKQSEAVLDYNGNEQTTTIINSRNGDYPAASYCREFIFPNGMMGYLGSAGEWQTAMNYKSKIVSAMSACGGDTFNLDYCTSTQYNQYYIWIAHLQYGTSFTGNYKDNEYWVRAFCPL